MFLDGLKPVWNVCSCTSLRAHGLFLAGASLSLRRLHYATCHSTETFILIACVQPTLRRPTLTVLH